MGCSASTLPIKTQDFKSGSPIKPAAESCTSLGGGDSFTKGAPTNIQTKSHQNRSSVNDTSDERGWSASSINSGASHDSGFNDEYCHVITESSDHNKVQEVLSSFNPDTDIDLSICGSALRTQISANSRTREEETIIRSLLEHGLISRPTAQAPGGLCFEVIETSEEQLERKPPSRLCKLVVKRRNKKSDSFQELPTADKALITCVEQLNEERVDLPMGDLGCNMDKRMDRAMKNRELHINSIRKKIRQHEHHISIVKQRRLAHMTVDGEDIDIYRSEENFDLYGDGEAINTDVSLFTDSNGNFESGETITEKTTEEDEFSPTNQSCHSPTFYGEDEDSYDIESYPDEVNLAEEQTKQCNIESHGFLVNSSSEQINRNIIDSDLL